MWEIFVQGGYLDEIMSGDLREQVFRSKHPSPPLSFEPVCTRSQIIGYFDAEGKLIVVVHRYLRPNKTIGASGTPDPKRILVGDTYYYVAEPSKKRAPDQEGEGLS